MITERARRKPKADSMCFVRLLLWVAVWCIGVPPLQLAAAEHVRILPARAVVRFAGTSTLHDFGGELPAQPFFLILSNGTWSAAADVLAGQMATENTKRDRNMHQMLGTNDHPRIHGGIATAPIPGSAGTNATLTLKIRDSSQALAVQIMNWTETAEEIRFRAVWKLSLKQYGLKPPSVIGVIRVGDTVQLEADVTASKPAPPPGNTALTP